jgi:similar to stage IV sporulation protein
VILEESGLPFFMRKNKKRQIFFAGIIITLAFLYGMTYYVWSFSFEGNENISDDILLRFVNSLGVGYGTSKSDIDIQMLEEEMREYFDGISWVSVRILGTKLVVNVKENYVSIGVNEKEEGIRDDLYAGSSGTIVSMITRKGVPQVKVGDEVVAGQILVVGEVPIYDNDGNIISYDYVDSDADVTIRTQYPIHRQISRYYKHKNYTGKEYKVPYFRIGQHYFGLSVFDKTFALYDVVMQEHTNSVFKEFSIPVFWGIRKYCEYVEIEDLYGDEEGVILLRKFLEQTMKELDEKGVQIIENNVKIETDSQYLKLTGYLLIDIEQKQM